MFRRPKVVEQGGEVIFERRKAGPITISEERIRFERGDTVIEQPWDTLEAAGWTHPDKIAFQLEGGRQVTVLLGELGDRDRFVELVRKKWPLLGHRPF